MSHHKALKSLVLSLVKGLTVLMRPVAVQAGKAVAVDPQR